MLMTHKKRPAFVISASTLAGAAVAEAILSAGIISCAPAAAAEAQEGGPSKMPPLIYSPLAEFCGKGNAPGAKEVCFTGKGAALNNQEANEGPPDPKVFEDQQKKLQEDLQKRADELRKKLMNGQGETGPSAPLRRGPGLLPACLPNC
jgi:hypothetical protein